jgi:hypothetical protein
MLSDVADLVPLPCLPQKDLLSVQRACIGTSLFTGRYPLPANILPHQQRDRVEQPSESSPVKVLAAQYVRGSTAQDHAHPAPFNNQCK